MHLAKTQIQTNLLLREIYEYSKGLQKYGTMAGLISIGLFFITKTYYIAYTPNIAYWVFQYPDFMRALAYLSILYTLILVILMGAKIAVQRVFQGPTGHSIAVILRTMATFLWFPYELSVYGIKSIIVITFSFKKEYRDLFTQEDGSYGFLYYLVCITMYLDFLITVLLIYTKCTLLRSLIPNGGFFSKVDGNFEVFFIPLIPVKHFFFYMSNWNDVVTASGIVKAHNQEPLFFICAILVMIIITAIYLKELPYYDPLCERIIAHFLLTTFWIFLLLGAFSNDLNMSLKALLFIIPLEIVAFEYFLKFNYRIDYMHSKQTKTYKILKKVMIGDNETSTNQFERVYNQGIFLNYIKNKRSISSQDANMWLSIQRYRLDGNGGLGASNSNDGDDKEENMSRQGGTAAMGGNLPGQEKQTIGAANSKTFASTMNHIPQTAEVQAPTLRDDGNRSVDSIKSEFTMISESTSMRTKLDMVIINAYVESNKKYSYSHLIRIYWMLMNRVVIHAIYSDLRDLLELATSLKAKFIYYYALKEVEEYFQKLYLNPEMLNINLASNIFSAVNTAFADSTDQAGINPGNNDVGGLTAKLKSATQFLDFSYALYQKHTIQYLKELIHNFSEKNNKLIDDMFLNSTNYQGIHDQVRGMYSLDKKIKHVFEQYHTNSKSTECEHIMPYCAHLSYNVNLLRSAKQYLAEYMKRSGNAQRIHEEKNPVIMQDNMLIDTVILLADSDAVTIGTILDVYGDTEGVLNVAPKNLIGKQATYLMPTVVAQHHNKILQNFIRKPIRYFLGAHLDSFVKIVDTNYVLSASLIVKVVPNVESNFKFIVAAKPNQKRYNQKIIIDVRLGESTQSLVVNAYSYNFLTLIEDQYLRVGCQLEELSEELSEFVLKSLRFLDKDRGTFDSIREKRLVVDSFNKYVSRELRKNSLNGRKNNTFGSIEAANQDSEGTKKASGVFELTFTNSKGETLVRPFEIMLEVKDLVSVNKKIYFLDCVPLEDTDPRLTQKKLDVGVRSARIALLKGHYEPNLRSDGSFGNFPYMEDNKASMPVQDRASKSKSGRSLKNVEVKIIQMPSKESSESLSLEDEADFNEVFEEFPHLLNGVTKSKEREENDTTSKGQLGDLMTGRSTGHKYKFLRDDDATEEFKVPSKSEADNMTPTQAMQPRARVKVRKESAQLPTKNKTIESIKVIAPGGNSRKMSGNQMPTARPKIAALGGNLMTRTASSDQHSAKNVKVGTQSYGDDLGLKLLPEANKNFIPLSSLGVDLEDNGGNDNDRSRSHSLTEARFLGPVEALNGDNGFAVHTRRQTKKPNQEKENNSTTVKADDSPVKDSVYKSNVSLTIDYRMKELRRVMNFEDAVKKGLDISAIRQLFWVSMLAIIVTLGLTLIMRHLIINDTDHAKELNTYLNRYNNMNHYMHSMYDYVLMRYAGNAFLVTNDRYVPILESSPDIQATSDSNKLYLDTYFTYVSAAIARSWDQLDLYMGLVYEYKDQSEPFFESFFNTLIEVTYQPFYEAPRVNRTVNLYDGLILMVRQSLFSMVNQTLRGRNVQKTVNDDFVVNNMLTKFSYSLKSMEDGMSNLIVLKLESLKLNIQIIYFVIIGLMVTAMTYSLILIWRIIKKFRTIFQCLESMRLEDLDYRNDQMMYVMNIMEKDKLKPQDIAVLTGSDTNSRVVKKGVSKSPERFDKQPRIGPSAMRNKASKSNRKTPSSQGRGFYFFTLLIAIVVLCLFYVAQFIFSGVIVSTLANQIKNTLEIYGKNVEIMELTKTITEYRNALLDQIIIGYSPEIQAMYLDRFEANENNGGSELARKINRLPLNFDFDDDSKNLSKRYQNILHDSLCDNIPDFQNYSSLCQLDVGIPQKGMVQVYFRVKYMFNWMHSQLKQNVSKVDIINSRDYISFELAYQTLYTSANLFMVNMFYEYINSYFSSQVHNILNLITVMIVLLVVLSCTFTLLLFKDIFKVKDEIAFSFQIYPLDGIIDNQRIRVVFLRLYKLDNQYFS